MTLVHALADLGSPSVALFEGARHGDGAAVSMFVTTWRRDRGPGLHRHPYPEVFLVETGDAVFTVDGEEHAVPAGHVVVVPGDTPHRFHNPADAELRVVSIHPSPEVVQENL